MSQECCPALCLREPYHRRNGFTEVLLAIGRLTIFSRSLSALMVYGLTFHLGWSRQTNEAVMPPCFHFHLLSASYCYHWDWMDSLCDSKERLGASALSHTCLSVPACLNRVGQNWQNLFEAVSSLLLDPLPWSRKGSSRARLIQSCLFSKVSGTLVSLT